MRLFFCFGLGVALYAFRDAIPINGALAVFLFVVAAILCHAAWFPAVAPVFYAYLVLYMAYALPPVVLKNDISYGIYIYGWPVENALANAGIVSPLAIFFIAMSVCIPIGLMSWFLVERPAIRLGRDSRIAVAA